MSDARVPLYDRLPAIYRIRDAEQSPAHQLRAYLAAVEAAFGALHADIAQLYEDLFIDTCDDWVIPYIADLLGTSHLKGDARTLRADVADTIALRRRKGTLGAIERLAVNLTGWSCRCVELRENLGWSQHLNHQRPDAGGSMLNGDETLALAGGTPPSRFTVPRGGTATLRDPAMLDLLGTPFDPFAYTADVKPAAGYARHINLPNLAVFLWRLADYRLPLVRPLARSFTDLGPQGGDLAQFALRFDLHPLDLPVRLFNTGRPGFKLAQAAGGATTALTNIDAVPGPMLDARITTDSPAGHPEAYAAVDYYDDAVSPPQGFDLGDVGLHLFLPRSLEPLLVPADPTQPWRWRWRGDNLCAWEAGLRRALRHGEIIVDPDIGRLLIGVNTAAQRDAIAGDGAAGSRLFVSFTYGAAGPVGAHPVTRTVTAAPAGAQVHTVRALGGGPSLQQVLGSLDPAVRHVVVEIADSFVHPLNVGLLRVRETLTIRAVGEHRPVVLLARPLQFSALNAAAASPTHPVVRLEGLYIAPGESFPGGSALITRAALARLELISCTLAPGGHRLRNGMRAAMIAALRLTNDYGFATQAEQDAFVPTPDLVLQHCITGALAVDERYRLDIQSCIVDAGQGVGNAPMSVYAIGAASVPDTRWGAALSFDGLTCLGNTRVSTVSGMGGLFAQPFEVLDNQHGCIKWSAFPAAGNRLPPNHFCVQGAPLRFTSEWFNDPGYGQMSLDSDARLRTLGPDDDAMGAFGFLLEAHKWTNLQVRLREFTPVGVRPLVVPIT